MRRPTSARFILQHVEFLVSQVQPTSHRTRWGLISVNYLYFFFLEGSLFVDFVGQPQLFSNTSLQVEKQKWVGGGRQQRAGHRDWRDND